MIRYRVSYYQAVQPQSAASTVPVTKLEDDDARKRIGLRIPAASAERTARKKTLDSREIHHVKGCAFGADSASLLANA